MREIHKMLMHIIDESSSLADVFKHMGTARPTKLFVSRNVQENHKINRANRVNLENIIAHLFDSYDRTTDLKKGWQTHTMIKRRMEGSRGFDQIRLQMSFDQRRTVEQNP